MNQSPNTMLHTNRRLMSRRTNLTIIMVTFLSIGLNYKKERTTQVPTTVLIICSISDNFMMTSL